MSFGEKFGELIVSARQHHGANICQIDSNTLGATFYAGSQEDADDVSVYFATFNLTSSTWSTPLDLGCYPTKAEQNPSLFVAPNGSIHLFWMAQTGFEPSTSSIVSRRSTDGGRTWDPPRCMVGPRNGREFTRIRQPVVAANNGKWLLPIYICHVSPGATDRSAVLISSNEGQSWEEYDISESTGLVHMNIVPLAGNECLGFFRSRDKGYIHRSISIDNGRNWSIPISTSVANFNSSMQVIKSTDNSLIMAHNTLLASATERDSDVLSKWRRRIVLSRSIDKGVSWSEFCSVDEYNGTANRTEKGSKIELSYPTLCGLDNGDIHVLYTSDRESIKHSRVHVSLC